MPALSIHDARRSQALVDHQSLARFLCQRREQLGIGQTELAIRAGLSREVVQRYEGGCYTATPSQTTLRKLANALSVDLRALIGAVVPLADVCQTEIRAELDQP